MCRCHQSHDVRFLAYGRAYCDCGHDGCNNVSNSSIEVARSFLPISNDVRHSKDLHSSSSNLNPGYVLTCTEEEDLKVEKFNVGKVEVPNELLVNQCKKLVSNSKDTFWLSASDMNNPTCALEKLAGAVFKHYTKGATFDASRSGAEWWAQVKDISHEESDDNCNRAIDLHYDKDEKVAEMFELGLFPQISTVTYLNTSQLSQPTIVLNKSMSSALDDPINEMYVSYPETSKHISFDGRFLHGAPVVPLLNSLRKSFHESPLACDSRITFLVNVWIHHIPVGVQRLPRHIGADLALIEESFSNFDSYFSFKSSPKQKIIEIPVSGRDARRSSFKRTGEWTTIPFLSHKSTWEKTDDEDAVSLNVFIPSDFKIERYIENVDATTFLLRYTEENCCARLEYVSEEMN